MEWESHSVCLRFTRTEDSLPCDSLHRLPVFPDNVTPDRRARAVAVFCGVEVPRSPWLEPLRGWHEAMSASDAGDTRHVCARRRSSGRPACADLRSAVREHLALFILKVCRTTETDQLKPPATMQAKHVRRFVTHLTALESMPAPKGQWAAPWSSVTRAIF